MNADVAQTLIAGQKIKYWDGRIATVTAPYTAPVAAKSETVIERFSETKTTGGEIGVSFDDDLQTPKAVHYIKDYDFRLAEPL